MLTRACELEHVVSCVYLFAAYSLKTDASEGGLTPEQAALTRSWKQRLLKVSREEMLHLAQLTNVLTAIGGAPHFQRPNFPMRRSWSQLSAHVSLEPFSEAALERFMDIEMPEPGILSREEQAAADEVRRRVLERLQVIEPHEAHRAPLGTPFDVDYATQGEFYHKIISGFDRFPREELFTGPPEAQAKARHLDFGGQMFTVVDANSARDAVEMVIEQGEAPSAAHPDAHFWVFRAIHAEYLQAVQQAAARGERFEPVRPVVANPMTRFNADPAGGMLITDPLTHQIADLFNIGYDTMLLMLMRFFAHTEESEAELERLAEATLRLMTNVLAPLGEALTKMPVAPNGPLAERTAGPGFGYNRDIQLLPHKRSSWIFFAERLHNLAGTLTHLWTTQGENLPPEVEAAVAGLQALAIRFAPADRTWNAAAQLAEFRAIAKDRTVGIRPLPNGPLIVSGLETFENSRGEALPVSAEIALCRCGHSKHKPYCDGTHSTIGFTGANPEQRTPDEVDDYAGKEITIHFNRLQCASALECVNGLPAVFKERGKPWITPDNATAQEIMTVIRRCPSGALRYTVDGATGPERDEPPRIHIRHNGPLEISGSVALNTPTWCEGATRQYYTLCRCGASRNKPFCDASHWRIKFIDEGN